MLDTQFIGLNVVEVLLSILNLDVGQSGDHLAILKWEAKEMSGYVHIVRLGLVELAGNDILNSSSNIELGFALDEIVVLDHAEAHKVLKMQK